MNVRIPSRRGFTLIEMPASPAVALKHEGRRQFRRAFTLIEMLVVVTILALLIALIVPAAGMTMERARRTACLSNVRQISTGAQLQFHDLYPRMPDHGADCLDWGKAAAGILAHLDDGPEIFDCPSNPGLQTREGRGAFATEIPGHPGRHTEYEINGYLGNCVGTRRQAQMTEPSRVAVAYDYPYHPGAERPHDGGINVAYADGHAAWLEDEDLGDVDFPWSETTFFTLGHPWR